MHGHPAVAALEFAGVGATRNVLEKDRTPCEGAAIRIYQPRSPINKKTYLLQIRHEQK